MQGPAEIFEEPLVLHRHPDSGGASLPNTHKPDRVSAQGEQIVPFLRGNSGERDLPDVFTTQFMKPGPCVYFVNDRIFRPLLHDDFFPPANIYAKIVRANTTDSFTNNISILPTIPGNSMGRS